MIEDSNLFNFTTIYTPLKEVTYQENRTLNIFNGEKNMEAILQRYKSFLCGEHTRKNTISNKLAATRVLLHQTGGVLNPETIQQLRIWANQHYSHNTRNNRINAWNQYLTWAGCPELRMKLCGFVETNQISLTEQEIDLLILASLNNPLERLALLCLFDGALRPSEIIDIRLDRRDGNRLYLDETKTGDKRIIMSPMLQSAWDGYLQVRPAPATGHEQYLILKDGCKNQGMKYLDTDPISDWITSISRLAGLGKHITPYTIRRTSATLRQNKYSKYYMGDDKLVQMLFRHKDIATTKRYDRTTDVDIERYFDDQSKRDKPDVSGINPVVSGINTQGSGDNSQETGIRLISCFPQYLSNQEGEDNSRFSFSVSFFVCVTCVLGGVEGDRVYPMSSLLPTPSLSLECHWTSYDVWDGAASDEIGSFSFLCIIPVSSIQSSFVVVCRAGVRTDRVFLCSHKVFLPNHFFYHDPGLYHASSQELETESISVCDVSSSERRTGWCLDDIKKSGVRLETDNLPNPLCVVITHTVCSILGRSNSGQVRALEYKQGGMG